MVSTLEGPSFFIVREGKVLVSTLLLAVIVSVTTDVRFARRAAAMQPVWSNGPNCWIRGSLDPARRDRLRAEAFARGAELQAARDAHCGGQRRRLFFFKQKTAYEIHS